MQTENISLNLKHVISTWTGLRDGTAVDWQSLKNHIEARICEFSSYYSHKRGVFHEMLHELLSLTEWPLRTKTSFILLNIIRE